MTLIAILTGVLALSGAAASFFAFRASIRAVDQLCADVRVLVVAVNGLESCVQNECRLARESADAAAAQVALLTEATAKQDAGRDASADAGNGVAQAAFSRIAQARALYGALEEDSFLTMVRRNEAAGG